MQSHLPDLLLRVVAAPVLPEEPEAPPAARRSRPVAARPVLPSPQAAEDRALLRQLAEGRINRDVHGAASLGPIARWQLDERVIRYRPAGRNRVAEDFGVGRPLRERALVDRSRWSDRRVVGLIGRHQSCVAALNKLCHEPASATPGPTPLRVVIRVGGADRTVPVTIERIPDTAEDMPNISPGPSQRRTASSARSSTGTFMP